MWLVVSRSVSVDVISCLAVTLTMMYRVITGDTSYQPFHCHHIRDKNS